MQEAWTWEHLALTRARVVGGNAALGADVETVRARVLVAKGPGDTVLSDVAEMRGRIAAAKPAQGILDAKIGPGRLQDVELTAQALALRAGQPARETDAQIAAGLGAGLLGEADAQVLTEAATLFWQLQATGKLLSGGVLDPAELGEGGRRLILRETGAESISALEKRIETVSAAAAGMITRLLGDTA